MCEQTGIGTYSTVIYGLFSQKQVPKGLNSHDTFSWRELVALDRN